MRKEAYIIRQMLKPSSIVATYKEHSTSATLLSASITLFLALIFGNTQVHPAITAAVSTGIVSMLLTLIASAVTFMKAGDSSKFFGLNSSRNLVIVLPTFYNRRHADEILPNYPEGYYKPSRLRDSSIMQKPQLRLTSYGDLVVINLLLTGIHRLPMVKLSIIMDERVASDDELLPPYYDGTSALICFGSEQFNDLAAYILNRVCFASGQRLASFTSSKLCLHTGVGLGDELSSSELIDYGLVTRVTVRPHGKAVTMFLCAGIDAPGTRALTLNLFNNWKSLRTELKDQDFVGIFKIVKSNYEKYATANTFIRPIGDAYWLRDGSGFFNVKLELQSGEG